MVKRRSLYLWKLPFFGLTQSYRAVLFRTIHEIVFYGRGGYQWGEVYNFPIWLRRITHNFIVEYVGKENEAQKSSNSTGKPQGSKTTSTTTMDWVNPDKSKLKPLK
jgi:hypothetical protein